MLEYNDRFSIPSITKPIYYEIYTLNGKITHSDEILTGDYQEISKPANAGIIVLKNELGEQLIRVYRRW